MIYETRIYETHPGRLPALNARFRNHTMKIFERHGIKNIGYLTSDVGEYSDRLRKSMRHPTRLQATDSYQLCQN